MAIFILIYNMSFVDSIKTRTQPGTHAEPKRTGSATEL